MLVIDEVFDKTKDQFLGIEISLDDEVYFISRWQGFWKGIRRGKFPPLANGELLYLPIFTADTITEGEMSETTATHDAQVEITEEIPVGWLCPRCRAVNAPDVKRCECEPSVEDNRYYTLGPSETK